MAIGSLRMIRTDSSSWRIAAAGLMLAAAIVGAAIVVGGQTSRVLNPIGAVLWLASAVLLVFSVPTAQRQWLGRIAALASGLILGALVRPGSLPEAVIGFAVAGVVVVIAAGDRSGAWALLAPATYLPVHLVIGIGRALVRDAGIRTDPPPTAAVVPLAMLLAALAGGALASWLIRRAR